jgi:uncharacterized peroxidase-related enzyme
MTFTETVSDADAEGAVAEIYAIDQDAFGFLPNFTRAFSLRPEAYLAWRQLNGAIKGGMDLRRYELVTLAAARRLRSSYCMLAHGSVLVDTFLAPDELQAVAADSDGAEALGPVDRAVMELAEKVVDDATSVTAQDFDALRALGLTDAEILDVVLAAAARCFFSKTLDAVGVQPDQRYARLAPELRDVLEIGRPIAAE